MHCLSSSEIQTVWPLSWSFYESVDFNLPSLCFLVSILTCLSPFFSAHLTGAGLMFRGFVLFDDCQLMVDSWCSYYLISKNPIPTNELFTILCILHLSTWGFVFCILACSFLGCSPVSFLLLTCLCFQQLDSVAVQAEYIE